MWVPTDMGVTFHATMNCGVIHVILKTITRTRTLKGGGFGLTEGQIYMFILFYSVWKINGKDMYTHTFQRNSWITIAINLPHKIPICMCIVCHEDLKVHLGDTILEHECIKILSKQGMNMGIQ